MNFEWHRRFEAAVKTGDLEQVKRVYDANETRTFPEWSFIEACMRGHLQIAQWMAATWRIDPMDVDLNISGVQYGDVQPDYAFYCAYSGGKDPFLHQSTDPFMDTQWPVMWWLISLNTPEEFWATTVTESMTEDEQTRAECMEIRHLAIEHYMQELQPVREKFMADVAPELVAKSGERV